MKITSVKPVKRAGWVFKVSELNGVLMVHSYEEQMMYSNIRFFDSEYSAKNHIDY